MQTHRTDQDVTVLNDMAEIPGLGFLPVNAFVIHAEQPVVIDTCHRPSDPRNADGVRRIRSGLSGCRAFHYERPAPTSWTLW